MIHRLVRFIVVAVVIYAATMVTLVYWPEPAELKTELPPQQQLLRFIADHRPAEPAPLQQYTARDGASRPYRLYPGNSADVMVLIHGSGSDSRYLSSLARALAAATGMSVATPDMRGHAGDTLRGDIAYPDQQMEDIADLVRAVRITRPAGRFVLAGHSIGGGLSIRYGARATEPKPDAIVLLAPYVYRAAPSARPDSGGWATPYLPRFAGITMLHHIGLHLFDGRPVLRFEMPTALRDGNETRFYSWRLYDSVVPGEAWQDALRRLDRPVLVLAAEKDSIFRAEGYAETFAVAPRATVDVIPGIDHFELASSPEVPRRAAAWLAGLKK